MDLTGDVHRAVQVDDRRAGGDDDGIIGKSGGKGKGSSRSLIRVHVGTALFPSILFHLAGGGAFVMVGFLLLLLASLLLLLLSLHQQTHPSSSRLSRAVQVWAI